MKFRDLFHAEINVIEPFLEALINEFRFSPDFKYGPRHIWQTATSMLVMDVGDGMFWRQLRDDGFDCFPKFQHSDATNIYVAIAKLLENYD